MKTVWATSEVIEGLANPRLAERFGMEMTRPGEIELLQGGTGLRPRGFPRQTPDAGVFFGSAINNFGVREVLDALVDLAPPPAPAWRKPREIKPDEPKLTGVVFKVQANMDPAHRDRIAFVRACRRASSSVACA